MPDLNEYQKASITVVKDVSVQLILIAVGVFALSGSFLAAQSGSFTSKGALITSFVLLMLSVLAGLVALGNTVAQLAKGTFDAYHAVLRIAYLLQLVAMLLGGIMFAYFLICNIP
jgi:hypothetical protein